jgi:hypothetical protein
MQVRFVILDEPPSVDLGPMPSREALSAAIMELRFDTLNADINNPELARDLAAVADMLAKMREVAQ